MMRLARIRGEGTGQVYHCMSRVAGGQFIFNTVDPGAEGALEAEYFVELMKKLSVFHGMGIVTWTLMSNHFHVLVREPARRVERIGDEELARRIGALNGERAGKDLARRLKRLREREREGVDEAGDGAAQGGAAQADEIKAKYLARMGDVSQFMKELKGRFAQWYNRRHGRYGVLWADRFKSVLVENRPRALRTMAGYIDLNCVRAKLVDDPAAYRYSGYGEASAGGGEVAMAAQRGLAEALGVDAEAAGSPGEKRTLRRAMRDYRQFLFVEGEEVRAGDNSTRGKAGLSAEAVKEVLGREGHVGARQLVRLRVRHFHAGLVLGSRRFVEGVFEANRGRFGARRKNGARPIRALGGEDREGLMVMRDLRKQAAAD